MTDRMRVFTIAEANAVLPRLNVCLERQMRLLAEVDAAADALRARGLSPDDPEPHGDDSEEVAALKTALRDQTAAFREGWTEVESLGAVVKDLRLGLVDFYGRVNGQLVWLCWKYGEPAVAHWHPLDQGFGARQPLERQSIPPTLN